MMSFKSYLVFLSFFFFLEAAWPSECDQWQTRHPEWIFCDDFEKDAAMVGPGRYFEYDDGGGNFAVTAGVGMHGSRGMTAKWKTAQVDAGSIKIGFGRSPSTYFSKDQIQTGKDFREIYYRAFVRLQPGFIGNPFKLSRTTVLAKSDWSQAMIAHLWGDRAEHLQLDPVSCVDGSSQVKCSGYNDFNNMSWLGAKVGTTPIYNGNYAGEWECIEVHVRLNDAGQSNGVHEYWINDHLDARREGLNFVGSYHDYGLNGVFFENYWNSGAPKDEERYLDEIVVSTQHIGCVDDAAPTPTLPQQGKAGSGSQKGQVLNLAGGKVVKSLKELRTIAGRLLSKKSSVP